MGEFARAVQDRLRDRLAATHPRFDWTTEFRVGRTPIDVVGAAPDLLVAVEVESRRADPANNTVTLFRHAAEGTLGDRGVALFQAFSGYYDLADGGVSSKRADAEFVGGVAADAFGFLSYEALDLPVTPPKRGGALPPAWREAADGVAAAVGASLSSGDSTPETS